MESNSETERLLSRDSIVGEKVQRSPGSADSYQSTDSGNTSSSSQEKTNLEKIDIWDKEVSSPIFNYEPSLVIEVPIYIFARLFNPDVIVVFFLITFVYQALVNKDYFFIIKPFIHVLVCLIVTLITKHVFGRPRPNIKTSVRRKFNCRSKETNCSMPSGDSMQCGSFAIIFLMYFNCPFGFLLIPFVMFSRIFYFCHYFLDTLVGSISGILLSTGVYFCLSSL